MNKRWKCTVCGYVHIGEEPPEHCPVCGADRTKFIPLDTETPGFFPTLWGTFKLHPVAAHFPSGLVPTAALFLALSSIFGAPALASAALWLLMVATAVAPVSIGSGLRDWQKHFGGRSAPVFFKKLGLASTLLVLGLAAIALHYGEPAVLTAGGWQRWLYIVCLIGMLGCTVLLGHFGAILAAQKGGVFSAEVPEQDQITTAWYQAIIAQAPDAILAADPSGIIRIWNHGAERIFGFEANAAIGNSLDLIIPESLRKRHWEGWARVMQTGASHYRTELLRVPALRSDGSRFSAEFSIVALKDETGRISLVAAILRDVTEQWEREKRLKEQLAACSTVSAPSGASD